MFFKSKKLLGLDIGSSSIKLAELNVTRSGATLTGFSMIPTPANSVGTGELTDIGSIKMAIQTLVAEIRTKRKNVCTGMWGTAVIVKKITIPQMDKKVVRNQLRFEAEQYIPFDINNVSLAHHILPTAQTPDTMDVVLVAAQNELVAQYSQVIQTAGLKPLIIDVSGFALANIFEANYGRFRNEIIGVLNFGANVINFVVIEAGEVVFCRDIPIGGSNYTNEISKSLGVTFHEAEGLKINSSMKKEVPAEVQQIVASVNDQVSEEIRNSLEFLSASSGGIVPSRCYYTGGSAQTEGLIETLVRSTGIPQEELNSFEKIKYSKKLSSSFIQQIQPFSAIALGLGLREGGDS
jgi:type IV pilus assembly protein PilM